MGRRSERGYGRAESLVLSLLRTRKMQDLLYRERDLALIAPFSITAQHRRDEHNPTRWIGHHVSELEGGIDLQVV